MRRMDLHPDRRLRRRARHEHPVIAAGLARLEAWFPEAACLPGGSGAAQPTGFVAHGTGLREDDSESDLTFEHEAWVVMEEARPDWAGSKGMYHDQV